MGLVWVLGWVGLVFGAGWVRGCGWVVDRQGDERVWRDERAWWGDGEAVPASWRVVLVRVG